jgi:Cu(I)/Ag(I) efflux system membrane fusion protein
MHVWLKKGKDSFEPRLVKTGEENDQQVEIVEGLKAGDQVVASGAYLLYSEFILKKGKNPIDGLK